MPPSLRVNSEPIIIVFRNFVKSFLSPPPPPRALNPSIQIEFRNLSSPPPNIRPARTRADHLMLGGGGGMGAELKLAIEVDTPWHICILGLRSPCRYYLKGPELRLSSAALGRRSV